MPLKKLAWIGPLPRLLLLLSLIAPLPQAIAGHPFVTDDTSTQGRGRQQLETNTDWVRQSDSALHVGHVIYSIGTLDHLDWYADLPLTFSAPFGVTDVALGAKWRFYETENTSLALKPELQLPTGNQRADRGAGRTNLALTLIGMHQAGPWTLYGNLGLASHRQTPDSSQAGERPLLWQLSAALSYHLNPRWMALADLGLARNPAADGGPSPAYFLSGMVYSPTPDIALDAGIKFGLNHAVEQRQFGLGFTWRF